MRIAFMGIPKAGGGYSRFLYLKKGLPHINFKLVTIGNRGIKYDYHEEAFITIGPDLDTCRDRKKLAQMFIEFIVKNDIDILIPGNSPIAISCIPFLPPTVQVVNIVNSDVPRVYKYVITHLEYVARVVCISPKQKQYLIEKGLCDESKIRLIPHGVKSQEELQLKLPDQELKIGFLGRLHQGHKQILLIPRILSRLSFTYSFHIVGDGPDREPFIALLEELKIPYTFHGFVPNNEIDKIVKNWDIMLFPSIVEGFGLTLIEAMNEGVVPVANILKGITDYIIQDSKSGFLIRNNNIDEYVERLVKLNKQRNLLLEMKYNANKRVKDTFDLITICAKYNEVFHEVVHYEKPEQQEFATWQPYEEYTPSLIQRLLNRIRSYL